MDSFRDFITDVSSQYKESVAFEIRRKIVRNKVTYKEIPDYLSKIETLLETKGAHLGDAILLWGLNCPEYALSLLTCFNSGRIAVPIDYRNSEEMIGKVITQTQPKIAFVSKYLNSEFIKTKIPTVIVIEDLFELIVNLQPISDSPASQDTELAEIVYTSGTTGEPKGVMITRQGLLENVQAVSERIPRLNRYETLSILPLSHMFEQAIGLLMMLKVGGKIVYLPKVSSLYIVHALEDNRVTHLVFVPQLLSLFLQKIRQKAQEENKLALLEKVLSLSPYLPRFIRKRLFKDIHSLFGKHFQFFGCGGAPLNKSLAQTWEGMGFRILEGYGATEVTAVATFNSTDQKKLGSVGKPVSGVTISFDENKEIIIESKALSKGYFNNPEKTKASFSDKGYRTGDMGYFDEQGFLHILGREAFKIVLSNGEKVFAEDIEKKINEQEGVVDSCVVEFPVNGEIAMKAFVIKDKTKDIPIDTIIKEANQRLESKQQIIYFEVWPYEDFPRTHTLKIDRNKVKAFANQNTTEGLGQQELVQIKDLYDILANISGVAKERIEETDTLTGDLMLDSLSRVELVAQFEEYLGILIDEAKITPQTTVKDLKDIVQNSKPQALSTHLPTWQFTQWGRQVSYFLTQNIMYPFHGHFVKLEVDGIEHLKSLDPGFIVAFNHPGFLDGVCILRVLAQAGYKDAFTLAGKGFWEVKKGRPIRLGLEALAGGIPLYETGHELIKVLQKSSDLLDEGYYMLFAPQGRLQTGGVQDKFKAGVGYIVKELQKPILPIKIVGYEEIWPSPVGGVAAAKPKDFWPKKRGTVRIEIMPPLSPGKNMSPIEIANLLEEQFQ